MRGQCFASTHAEQPQATTRPPSLPSQLHHDPLDTPTSPTLRPHATHHSSKTHFKSLPYPFYFTLLLITALFSCLTTSLTLAQQSIAPPLLVPAPPISTAGPPIVTTNEIIVPSPTATALPSATPTHLGFTNYTDYTVQSNNCSETPRPFRFSIITHGKYIFIFLRHADNQREKEKTVAAKLEGSDTEEMCIFLAEEGVPTIYKGHFKKPLISRHQAPGQQTTRRHMYDNIL